MIPSNNQPPSWWPPIQQFLESKVIGWGLPGAFVAIAVDHARNQQWKNFALFLGIAAVIWLLINKLWPHLNQLLDWLLDNLVRAVQTAFAEITDSTEGKYFRRLAANCRDYEGRGFNAGGLSLEDVYVPLKLSERSMNDARQDIINRQPRAVNASSAQKIGVFLRDISNPRKSCKHLVILGAPGSGKSTLLRHITLMYAIRKQRRLHPNVPNLCPIFLRLRDVYSLILDNPEQSLADLATKAIEVESSELKAKWQGSPFWFSQRLRKGRCLVMLDGLDEIADDDKRQQVSQWVDQQLSDFYQAPFILTSRPDAYKKAPLHENAIELEVQPFSILERNAFIRNWCANWRKSTISRDYRLSELKEKSEKQSQDLIQQIDALPSLRLMANNPLLLSLMARTHTDKGKLAPRRVDLYRDVCQVLLEGRQRYRLASASILSAPKKQEILQVLALEISKRGVLQFTLDDRQSQEPMLPQARSLIQSQLDRVPKDNKPTPDDFVSKDEVGIREMLSDRQQEHVYEFAHRTFQEYLTAVELKRSGREDILISAFQEGDKSLDWWRETIRFYAAQTDATAIVQAALDHPSHKGLSLAYECLQETEDVSPGIRAAFDAKVEQLLTSEQWDEVELAVSVRILARLNRLNPDVHVLPASEIDAPEIVDPQPITMAEMALATMRNDLKLHPPVLPLSPEAAVQPAHNISLWDAHKLCNWYRMITQEQLGISGVCYYCPADLGVPPTEIDANTTLKGNLRLVRFCIPERYVQLASYLANGDWKEADQETAQLMLMAVGNEAEQRGYLNLDEIRNFPCDDLRLIDQLWVKYSGGKFGFSVQKQLWVEVGGKLDYGKDREAARTAFEKMCDRNGWRENNQYISYGNIKFDTNAPKSHLPYVSLEVVFIRVLDIDIVGSSLACSFFSRIQTCKL
jgi:energy-coupling factor transporter ATP-binding protein EcfA2